MHPLDAETRLCGVIGHPIAHSLSPCIHNAGYAALGLNFVYLAFEVENVKDALAGFRAIHGFRGLSVTIPHKIAVIPFLDELDPVAQKVGSVNTISKSGDTLRGSTTDGPGVLRALKQAAVDSAGKRVLVLGSGGAVRAVTFAMADLAATASIRILGRTPANVESLTRDLNGKTATPVTGGNLESDLAEALEEADIIIQGTPVGMHGVGEEDTPIPIDLLSERHTVFDMVYRPRKTRLIRDAEQRGCTTILGIEMLLHQAALQFELWTGREAPLPAMRDAAARFID